MLFSLQALSINFLHFHSLSLNNIEQNELKTIFVLKDALFRLFLAHFILKIVICKKIRSDKQNSTELNKNLKAYTVL